MFKKLILVFMGSFTFIVAQSDIKPSFSLNAHGDVQDMVLNDKTLFVATNKGVVDIFNLEKRKMQSIIKISKIKDFALQPIDAKIYSVDAVENEILFVSEGEDGYRNLWFLKDKRGKKVIGTNQKWFIKEAKFVDKDRVLIALLSNEIILWEINTQKIVYKMQPTTLSFSHFVLSEDKKTFASTDESGEVRVFNTFNGKLLKLYSGINLDKIFQLDYKKGVILSAGQDRKAGIYGTSKDTSLDFDFLLYSVALSHDAKYGAIAYNENNDIVIVDILSKNRLYNLQGSISTISKILFVDDNTIMASSEDKKINIWSLR